MVVVADSGVPVAHAAEEDMSAGKVLLGAIAVDGASTADDDDYDGIVEVEEVVEGNCWSKEPAHGQKQSERVAVVVHTAVAGAVDMAGSASAEAATGRRVVAASARAAVVGRSPENGTERNVVVECALDWEEPSLAGHNQDTRVQKEQDAHMESQGWPTGVVKEQIQGWSSGHV